MNERVFDALVLTDQKTYFKAIVQGQEGQPLNKWKLRLDHTYEPRKTIIGIKDILVDLSREIEQ